MRHEYFLAFGVVFYMSRECVLKVEILICMSNYMIANVIIEMFHCSKFLSHHLTASVNYSIGIFQDFNFQGWSSVITAYCR